MLFLLAACALILGFTFPYTSSPITSFPTEWLSALGWLFFAMAVLNLRSEKTCATSTTEKWIVTLPFSAAAFVILLQATVGHSANTQVSSLGVLYLLFASLIAASGHEVARKGDSKPLLILALIILISATINSIFGWMQYLAFPQGFGHWLVPLRDPGRIYGNLRQPNFYLVLLTMGSMCAFALASIAVEKKKAKVLLFSLAIFLSASSALAGSRLGLLTWVVIAISALFLRILSRNVRLAIIGASASHVVMWPVLALMQNAFGFDYFGTVRIELMNTDATGSRYQLWTQLLAHISNIIWSGTGWGRFNEFYVQVPNPIDLDVTNAHNIILHLIIEFGAPVTLMISVLFTWILWRSESGTTTNRSEFRAWSWLFLTICLLHSLIDWPWWFIMWLGPLAFIFGYLSFTKPNTSHAQPQGAKESQQLKKGMFALIMSAGITIFIAKDYLLITTFFADGRKNVEATMIQGYKSVFFAHYIDYAAVVATPVLPSNVTQHAQLTDKVGRFRSDGKILAQRMSIALLTGNKTEAMWIYHALADNDITQLNRVRTTVSDIPQAAVLLSIIENGSTE